MRKLFFTSLILLFPCLAFCQVNPGNFANMVDFLPPPPNAAAIAKAGLFNLNKNTGAPSVNIPLYSLKGRKLGLDVSLSYSSNGIKVDEIASRAGMGWTLNAGGVVTRTVRGKQDEDYSTYRQYPWATVAYNWSTYNYMYGLSRNVFDAEPDMFNFNFNGYSGGFVLDANMQVVLVPHSNVKVEYNFPGTAWNFKITAPDGVKYYFGGSSATEKTKRLNTCGKAFASYVPTAWYLIKVEHPNGEIITLNYTNHSYDYDTGLSGTAIYEGAGTYGTGNCPQPPSTVGTDICHNAVNTTGVLLDEMTSASYGKIKFIYGTRPDCADKIITSVEQWNLVSNQKISSFVFGYTNYSTATYNNYNGAGFTVPYLTSLDEKSSDNAQSKTHRFVYNDPEGRPCRLAFAQDHWGYFNGKNNTTVLPYIDYVKSKFPSATANRAPDPNYAVKGMLTKIVYPTGGADSIIYEGNSIAGNENINPHHQTVCSVTGTGTNTIVTKTFPFTAVSQVLSIAVSVSCSSGNCYGLLGTIKVKNAQNVTFLDEWVAPGTSQTFSLYVGSSSYTLELAAGGATVTNNVTLSYYPVDVLHAADNLPVGGVRVKEMLTANPGERPLYKKYYYGELATLNKSSLAYSTIPQYHKVYQKRIQNYCAEWGSYLCYQDIESLHSNSLVSLFNYGGSLVSYQSVVESSGEDFDIGGVQSKFYASADYNAQLLIGNVLYNAPQTNGSVNLNGKPGEETILKKTGSNTLVPLKKTAYRYTYADENLVKGYVANQRLYMACFPDTTVSQNSEIHYAIESYDLVRYDIHAPWVKLDSLSETIYDENGQNPLTSNTKYYYTNNNHLQATSTETTNSRNETIKTYNKYPEDFEGIPNLPYSAMLGKHIITPVIDSRKTNNNSDVEEIKNNYADWGNGNFEVANIQRSVKGNSLQNIGTISKYDGYGNILEYTGNDGVVNAIIWGYKSTYPVAKITGVTFDQAKAWVDTSAIQTLDGTALLTALNSIRTNLSNSQVVTYTYKPLIGVTTITDANNKTNTYEYDVFNRLVLIKDQDGNAVKKIEYSYNGPNINQGFVLYYNTAISRSYTCRNCVGGTIGSSVIYTVPAGKWFSVVSQASADAKAAADTLANGQLHADRTGTCLNLNCINCPSSNCSPSNCTGVDKKCVCGICETGFRENLSTYQNKWGQWICVYRYRWSDGSVSPEYTEFSNGPCPLN